MKWIFTFVLASIYLYSSAQRGLLQYSKEEGLISNETREVTVDQDGFVWIATSKGIDRFDGQRFMHFTHNRIDSSSISSNDIQGIAFDGVNAIWAFTYNKGLIQIKTENFEVTNFSKKNIPSFGSNYISAILPDKSGIWYTSTDGQLFRFNHLNNQTLLIDLPKKWKSNKPIFTTIFSDKIFHEKLWLTSSNGLFSYHIKRKEWKYYEWNAQSNLYKTPESAFNNHLISIEQDSKGNLFLGQNNGGMLYFDQYQGLYKQIPIQIPNYKNISVSAIKWFDSRYLYLCLLNGEICLFDCTKKTVIRYDESERSAINPIKLTTFGSRLIVASSNAGIFIHDNSIIYGRKVAVERPLFAIQFSKDKKTAYALLGGKQFSLRKIKGTGVNQLNIPGLMNPSSFSILSNYNLVLTGSRELYLIKPNGEITQKPLDFEVHSAQPFGDSILYIGTKDSRLFRINLESFSITNIHKPIYHSTRIGHIEAFPMVLCATKDKLIFSEKDNLFQLDYQTNKVTKIEFWNQEDSDIITALTTYGSKLWIGTKASGVWKYDLVSKRFTNNEKPLFSLQGYEVKQLLYDGIHSLWILNPQCIIIYNLKTHQVHRLEKQNGVSDIQKIVFGNYNYYFIQDNSLIISTKETKLPPQVKAIPYLLQVYPLKGEKRFPKTKHHYSYQENSLVFEYGIQDYSLFDNKQVSYRLVGLDSKWINGNKRNEAFYYNLSGGQYEFQVKVTDNNHYSVYSYHFSVSNPFWKSWWFALICMLAISFGIWIYIRTRIKRVKNTEQMKMEYNLKISELESKALRAQMNPHFLFNSLNSIRLFILKNEVDNAADYIAKFSKLLRMILNHSRQDMITVYDEIQSLKLYLEFERLRFDRDFDFDLQIDGQKVLDCQIPPMIIQPFIENAIWHGLMPRKEGKGRIRVSFQKQLSGLYVMVEDNGIGREKAKSNNRKRSLKEGSVGLQITKERLLSLSLRTKRQNEFEIEDLIDENGNGIGTLVTLYFETPN